MTPEYYQRVMELFQQVSERSPDARATFLNEACAGDNELRREVEAMLAADETTGLLEMSRDNLAAAVLAAGQARSLIGRRLGDYQVLSRLGAGGMGEVYLAEDLRLGRKAALKLLPEEFATDQTWLRRFDREARALSALNHPNIVTIYGIGQDGLIHFLATEFVEGRTLREEMAKGPLDRRIAIEIAAQVASALSAAHGTGIVHRDIKPENIILRPDGLVKVLDFGLAKRIETEPSSAETRDLTTQLGVILGTVRYMSPEQARGLQVDARTDLFSLGVVLYEMIAGRPPFTGATASDIIAEILKAEPPRSTQRGTDELDELDRILAKALRKFPAERYQSAGDLMLDLKNLKQRMDFETARHVPEFTTAGDGSAYAGTVTTPHRPRRYPRTRMALISVFAAAVLMLAVALYRLVQTPAIDSIAVLPFSSSGSDAGMEYFGDALADSILGNLSKLSRVRVMAHSTVSHYRDPGVDPRKVGRELHVGSVLLGRVLWREGHLKITTELVKTSDGSQLWGHQYDQPASDAFAVEQQITNDVCRELRLRLSGEERDRLAPTRPEKGDAYELYSKGRYFWNKRSDEGIEKAIDFYKQALDIDPTFAPAWSGLALSYMFQGGTKPPGQIFPQAKAAALKAMELDSRLADPHFALGYIDIQYFWNWQEAETELKHAIELNPGTATAHSVYGRYLGIVGRFSECASEFHRAQTLDPLSIGIGAGLGLCYYWGRQDDRAIVEFKKTLDMEPRSALAWADLATTYAQKRMFKEASAAFDKALSISPSDPQALADYSYANSAAGRREDALKLLAELTAVSKRSFVSPYYFAIVYTGLGQKDDAFQWLEQAYQQHSFLTLLKVEPKLDPLRSDPRFDSLLRRLRLAP